MVRSVPPGQQRPAVPYSGYVKLSDRARRGILQWTISLVLLGALAGTVAVLGGFEPVHTPPGYVQPGEPQRTTRWEFRVDRAELATKDYSDEKVLRVWFTLTNLWEETLSRPGDRIVAVSVGDELVQELIWRDANGGTISMDPGVPRRVVAQVKATELPQTGDEVTVRLGDESESTGLVSHGWGLGREINAVKLTVEQG